VQTIAAGDLAGPVDWAPMLAGTSAVVHLAALAHIGPAVSEAVYDQVNHRAVADLAAACARAGVRRLVLVSSVRAQCGPAAATVVRETDAPHPTEPYGRAKLAAEEAVRSSGLDWTILRPVVIYGPGVKGNFASVQRLARLPLPLPFGSFSGRRSLLGLDNLIGAIRFVLAEPRTARETYLVADPRPLTLGEMIAALREGTGHSARLFSVPAAWLRAALNAVGRGEAYERIDGSLVADNGKLLRAGWMPAHDAAEGLRRLARTAR
jgi:UDP-glucose 4-epimerase